MKILLDENLDWRLGRNLPGHLVESVPLIGWAGLKNGALLTHAVENGFQVLITMDGNLPHQQNLQQHRIAVIGLRAPSNRLADTQAFNARRPQIFTPNSTRHSHYRFQLS